MTYTPNEKVWIFGGLSNKKNVLGDFWVLNVSSLEWEHLSMSMVKEINPGFEAYPFGRYGHIL